MSVPAAALQTLSLMPIDHCFFHKMNPSQTIGHLLSHMLAQLLQMMKKINGGQLTLKKDLTKLNQLTCL
jgi:hypothetical protein